MQAQQSARHWHDILWFLFVSAILGLTCGLTAGGVALLLATPAYGAESPTQASRAAEEETEGEEEDEAPLVCTGLVLRTGGQAVVVCRPRRVATIRAQAGATCCSPS